MLDSKLLYELHSTDADNPAEHKNAVPLLFRTRVFTSSEKRKTISRAEYFYLDVPTYQNYKCIKCVFTFVPPFYLYYFLPPLHVMAIGRRPRSLPIDLPVY